MNAPDERDWNETITWYFAFQKQIHEYFGYQEDWKVIPMVDFRDDYWFITSEVGAGQYCHSEMPFTKESIEAGAQIYGGSIYTQRFLPKWVYRGEKFTMVCMDTHTDGNKYLGVFSNDKECKDDDLKRLYEDTWGA